MHVDGNTIIGNVQTNEFKSSKLHIESNVYSHITNDQHKTQLSIENSSINNGQANTSMGIGVMNDGKGTIQVLQQYEQYLDLLLQPLGGNVGIGTTNPGGKLHVNGTTVIGGSTGTAVGIGLTNPGNIGKGIQLIPYFDTDSNAGGRIFFQEDKFSKYGFSLGFNGDDNGILNWPNNTFNISNHYNNTDGNIAVSQTAILELQQYPLHHLPRTQVQFHKAY